MMLQENKRVRKIIHSAFEDLMGPHMNCVDDAIEPGLTKLSWTSLNIHDYVQTVYKCGGTRAAHGAS
jgi:dynein heavy chain